MKTPFFTRREILKFLLDDARHIDTDTERGCWRETFATFSAGVFDGHEDRPLWEFQSVCQFYGFQPAPNAEGRWTMRNCRIERVTP